MLPQKQKFRHRPDEGMIGDCHRTAIACLLDLPAEFVPHFGEVHWNEPEKFNAAFEDWLAQRGLRTIVIPYDCELQHVQACIDAQNKGAYYLLGGMSRTGVNHTVVGCGGVIAWDPSLDDAGIVGPCDDGYYWVTFIVPDFMYRSSDRRSVVGRDQWDFLQHDRVEEARSMSHHCHWPGCTTEVPPAMWGCKQHWFKLPLRLRNKIWAAYRPGQEITKTPSKEYLEVANEVQRYIKENFNVSA